MFFRIKVRALEPKTKREFNPPLEVMSAPIKVISKPKQMKKRKATKRRSLNDMLVETVQRIEEQQQAQQETLEQMIRRRKRKASERDAKDFKAPPTFSTSSFNNSGSPMNITMQNISTFSPNNNNNNNIANNNFSTTTNSNNGGTHWNPSASAEEELTVALGQFFMSFEQLEADERPTKIRRVMRNLAATEAEQLSTLFEDLISNKFNETGEKEEKKKDFLPAEDGCNCLDCPHKLELEKIDEFYKDFLASEIPLMDDMELGLEH